MSSPLVQSFRDAFSGIAYVLRSQRNARIHLVVTVAVAVLGVWLELNVLEWTAVAIAAGLVWAAEFINTALEVTIDLISPGEHSLAGIAKDISAGAVLLAVIAAVIVGVLVLGPPLIGRIIP